MSEWGKLDRKVLTGTANANVTGNAYIIGTGTSFDTNAQVGYSLVIANVNYAIASILSSNVLTLDTNYVFPGAGANVNLTVAVQESPKWLLSSGHVGSNTQSKQNVYGVDRDEVANTLVKAKGIGHTGWVNYSTYTDAFGLTRNKSEVLVAMSKNFNANVTNDLQVDANDDTVIPE